MTVLFDFLNPLNSSLKPKVASGKQEAQWIALCVLILMYKGDFKMKNMCCLSFSTMKKHMTPLGNMEFRKNYMIWTSCDVCPFLFKTFYLKGNLVRVRVGASLSDLYNQVMGVPQVIILSVIQFIDIRSTASPAV